MSDTETPETPETPKPGPPAPAPKSDELPSWARDQISAANQEAANYRVQLREEKAARKGLEEQVTALTGEKAAAVAAQASVQNEFDRLFVTVQADVPRDHIVTFANSLKGGTVEEMSAHAAELKSMFGGTNAPRPAVDRSQGQGGGGPAPNDPAAVFAEMLSAKLFHK